MKNEAGETLCDLCRKKIAEHDSGMMVHGHMRLTAVAPCCGVTLEVHDSVTAMCLECAKQNPFVDKQKLLAFLDLVIAQPEVN